MRGSSSLPEEKRSFTAEFAGSIWYGDVMHGPRVAIKGQLRKTYLVSLIDDASRLVAHSAFCLGETALDIEGVLKQALLRRGVPRLSRARDKRGNQQDSVIRRMACSARLGDG